MTGRRAGGCHVTYLFNLVSSDRKCKVLSAKNKLAAELRAILGPAQGRPAAIFEALGWQAVALIDVDPGVQLPSSGEQHRRLQPQVLGPCGVLGCQTLVSIEPLEGLFGLPQTDYLAVYPLRPIVS